MSQRVASSCARDRIPTPLANGATPSECDERFIKVLLDRLMAAKLLTQAELGTCAVIAERSWPTIEKQWPG